MFRKGNVEGITKYLLLGVLTLSSECLAAVNREQNGDSNDELLSKSSSRHLLYSWDEDMRPDPIQTPYDDTQEKAIYIIVSFVIFIIAISCRFCIRYGCNDIDGNTYPNPGRVIHSPPRTSATAGPPPSFSGYRRTDTPSGTRSNVLAPPRTSSSIILPLEADTFPSHLYGFDNPNYQPDSTSSGRNYAPISQNETPLCDVMDMPPAYDAVVRENKQYPTTKKN